MAEPDIKPIYVLHGKDIHLRAQARKRIVSRILGDADPQLCLAEFDASAELPDVLDELRTLPFLAPHRLVIITDAEAFISSHRQALEKYFDSPSATGTLILMVSTWNSNTKLAKKLQIVGELVACAPPEGRELIDWIRAAAAERGKKIDGPAASMLADSIGADLASLASELEKVSLYVGDSPAITAEDITAIVTAKYTPAAFAMANAITLGDVKTALRTLAAALRTRGAEFQVLGQLAWHIRRALAVQQRVEAGENPTSAMRAAKVFYNQAEFQTMLQRRSLKKLQADMRKLITADLGMKRGAGPQAAMQQLVIELCN
jgi:DNA polymerase-3 subunit delta